MVLAEVTVDLDTLATDKVMVMDRDITGQLMAVAEDVEDVTPAVPEIPVDADINTVVTEIIDVQYRSS